MPWKQNPDTGESYWVEDRLASDTNMTPPASGSAIASASPTAQNDAKATVRQRTLDYLNPASPSYKGPGYDLRDDGNGNLSIVPSSDPKRQMDQSAYDNRQNPAVPDRDLQGTTNAALDRLDQDFYPAAPKAPADPRSALSAAGSVGGGFGAPAALANTGRKATGAKPPDDFLSRFDLGQGAGASTPPPATGTEAPTVNREHIDPLLNGINSVQQQLANLANETQGMSPAEAALHKASREADLRTAFATEQSQRSALGAARGARNRGDRALLERQAVGEAGFMGQDAARTQALQQAEQEGNLAQLRATEEDADRRFKADVLGKAAELGLNTAAFEVDISKADLGSATNWLNNQFDKLKSDGQLDLGYAQLDQQKAESVLGFTKDMAALQYQYDALSVEDQNATDALLMQKYGIDQQTMVALKKIKADSGMNWGQVLTAVVGGIGSGATAAIAKTSDERTKEDIVQVDPEEFDELMEAVKPETWRYKSDAVFAGDGTAGKRLGPMTQDLKRSRLGKSMVIEQPGAFDAVDSGRAGLAALSGLALVHERLKALEAS